MRGTTVSGKGTTVSTKAETAEAAGLGQDVLYHWEHWLAWLMAAVAIGLGVFAALVGYGIIEREPGGAVVATDPGGTSTAFANGLVLLLPAIGAAILSYSMHMSDHHRVRYPLEKPVGTQALWIFEHFLAMFAGSCAIALGVFGILIGYDVLGRGNVTNDGFIWSLLGIGASILSLTFHSVRHHQVVGEEDYLVRIVDERVRGASITPPTYRETAYRETGAERVP